MLGAKDKKLSYMAKPLQSHKLPDNLFVYNVLSGKLKQLFIVYKRDLSPTISLQHFLYFKKNCFVVHPTLKEKLDGKDLELPYKAKPLQSHK